MHMNEIHIAVHRLYNHGEIGVQDPEERDERVLIKRAYTERLFSVIIQTLQYNI